MTNEQAQPEDEETPSWEQQAERARKDYAGRIKTSLRKHSEDFREAGRLLQEAKDGPCKSMKNPEWDSWLKTEVGIPRTIALTYMVIAKSDVLQEAASSKLNLPTAASALYKIAKRTEDSDEAAERVREALSDGRIGVATTAAEVTHIIDGVPEASAREGGMSKFLNAALSFKKKAEKEPGDDGRDGYEQIFDALTERDKENLRSFTPLEDLAWLPVIRKRAMDEQQELLSAEKEAQVGKEGPGALEQGGQDEPEATGGTGTGRGVTS